MKPKTKNLLLTGAIHAFALAPTTTFAIDSVGDNALGQSWDTGEDWSDGNPAASGNDYFIKSGFTIRTPEGTGNFVFPGDSLTIEGTLGLKNRTPITANIIGNGGQISQFSNSLNPNNAIIRGTITLTGDLTFNISPGRIISVESDISGPGGISKLGSGTLNLSSANNTFAGATTLAGGTLELTGGNNRLPTSSVIDFTGSSTLDLTNTTQTISSFTVPFLTNMAVTVTGAGGSLIVNGNSNLQIGPGMSPNTNKVTSGIAVDMDFSGLSTFTYDSSGNVFRVGLKGGSGNTGTLGKVATVTLAGSNNITAATLAVGDVAANSDGGSSTLNLGTANDIRVDVLNNGYSGRSDSSLGFATGLTNPTATIRNTDGSSAVTNWLVGNVATFNNSVTWTDTVDFTAGTLDAKVSNLFIGNAVIGTASSRGGTESASFSMGKGTLEASTITLGRIDGSKTDGVGSTLSANGTFNLDDATGLVKTSTLRFAQNTIASTSGTKLVNGTFNLISGTLEAGSITLSSQTGTATGTSNFNWTNGTIRNSSGSDLIIRSVPITLISGTHTFQASGSNTITVELGSGITGSGGLVKTGTGTLRLEEANTYDGDTQITQGTLALGNSASLGNTKTTISSGATLVGGGTINGSTTIAGTHAVGFLPTTQTFTNSLAYAANSTRELELFGNSLTFAGADYDLINVNGGNLTIDALATLTLMTASVDYSRIEWASARDFTVIDFSGGGSSDGNFLLDTSLAGAFDTYGTWSTLNSGGDIILSWTPIPEPSSALLAAAMSALLLTRRRR